MLFECEFCKKTYSSKSNLTYHKKTTKSCLALRENVQLEQYKCSYCEYYSENKNNTKKHETTCKCKLKPKSYEILFRDYENAMKIIEDLKIQNKDLQDRIQSLAEKAISKPSNTSTLTQNTSNQIINNMMPITDAHLQEHVQNLNPLHVQNGASGYAKYALEFPLKDMIVCTDFQRRNCKYKDENGNVVSDPEMTKITKRLFSAIKERNEELINEYSAELQAKWRSINESGNTGMDQEECDDFASQTNVALEFVMDVLSQKRQASEMADGMRPNLFYEFIRELAAGCYRSEK
uniref:C2H2-type domain-containing protein n=1 Tax=viral metagenome TaxID=1070528 RepID=A0A6C0H3D2_9ZZZZ